MTSYILTQTAEEELGEHLRSSPNRLGRIGLSESWRSLDRSYVRADRVDCQEVFAMAQVEEHQERFVVDAKGERVAVLLSLDEYSEILEELEELESIRAYDAAKASGEEPIPFESAIRDIENQRTA